MTKHLQIFLLCILLICTASCTVKSGDPESSNTAEKRAAITVLIEPNPDINAQKYKVGIKKIDGAEVTSREAVSTSYTFVVNSGSYIFYAIAYDTDGSITGKAEKETTVSDGSKISLTVQPVSLSAIFSVSPDTVLSSCITQVKITVNNSENYLIPYKKGLPIIFDKITKEGTYNLDIKFLDKNEIAYFEDSQSVYITEKNAERTITPEQTKVTPLSFNFAPGSSVSSNDEITISCETKNVQIYYTTDNSEPSSSSALYSAGLKFAEKDSPITIKAIGIADKLENSEIQTAEFIINGSQISAPIISPKSCTFSSSQTITIACTDNDYADNCEIYYTTNSENPTRESTKYTEPFTIYNTATVKAITYHNSAYSSTVSETFTLQAGKLPKVQISENNSTVELTCSDMNADIYYTIDDSEPDESDSKYSAPFTIDYSRKDIIVKAKAFRKGWTASELSEQSFICSGSTSAPVITIYPESGSIASSKTFSITVNSDALLINAKAIINGSSYNLVRGKNEFRVSDFASLEGAAITVRAEAESRSGSDNAIASLSIADPKLTGKFNELRIYQVMVESFQSGNSLGFHQGYGPSKHDGDIQGIINALDYIKGLGMNALWLTPIFNTNANTKLAATGYYAYDYFSIDPHFGTIEDFKNLVDECHKRNMYIILDGVFGHWSDLGCKASPSGITPQRSHGQYDGCDYPGENNSTLEFFKEVATYWIKNYKIDGWRLDQCYQTGLGNSSEGDGSYTNGHNYWYEIRTAVEEAAAANGTPGTDWGSLGYMVGEHWNGDDSNPPTIQRLSVNPGKAGGYGLRSCFDFPSRYKLVQMFAMEESKKVSGISLSNLDYVMKSASDKGYYHPSNDEKASGYLPNLFITNHDLVRLGDLINWKYNNDNYWKRHKVALSVLAAYTGPITIYYGDEYADKSNTTINSDNTARTSGRISDFTPDEQDLHDYVAKLMTIRNENEALWNGTYTKLSSSDTFFAAQKSTSMQTVIYLVNYSNSPTNYNVGTGGTDLMTGEKTSSNVRISPLSAMFILKD